MSYVRGPRVRVKCRNELRVWPRSATESCRASTMWLLLRRRRPNPEAQVGLPRTGG